MLAIHRKQQFALQLVSFEILHGAFVFLGCRARVEGTEIFSLTGFRILLFRVQPIFA
jgi:hypothetical protein